MEDSASDAGLPTARMFKRTFHYGSHHIEETRWVETGTGMFGVALVKKVTLQHVIDGWDRVDNTYLPYIFKYLDKVDSRNEQTLQSSRR
jgi:hypothetical protein